MVNRVGSGSGYHIYDQVNLTNSGSDEVSEHDPRGNSYADIAGNISEDDKNGVILDLSTDKTDKSSDKAKEKSTPSTAAVINSTPVSDTSESSGSSAGKTAASVITAVRNVLDKISAFFNELWNGSSDKSGSSTSGAGTAGTASSTSSGATVDAAQTAAGSNTSSSSDSKSIPGSVEVKDLPRTDNLDSIRSYLSDYDGRRLAHNSDLLTSYDRFGRLVEPNVSDKDKIIRGDSGSLIDSLSRKQS